MDIKRVLCHPSKNETDLLEMILSNRIDGYAGDQLGPCISFKNFDLVASDIIEWRKQGIMDSTVYERHINLLGFKAKDKVTGFNGVIDLVCFDLNGCVQVSLMPPTDKDGKLVNGHWFNITRLTIDTDNRVVNLPNFYEGYVAESKKGPADKPRSRA